jgi:hypothetical protein
MKRVMPSTGVSNARPETILSLRQRLALLHELERKLKQQSAVLDACRPERITRAGPLVERLNAGQSTGPASFLSK